LNLKTPIPRGGSADPYGWVSRSQARQAIGLFIIIASWASRY
jgi:hypothetical protein